MLSIRQKLNRLTIGIALVVIGLLLAVGLALTLPSQAHGQGGPYRLVIEGQVYRDQMGPAMNTPAPTPEPTAAAPVGAGEVAPTLSETDDSPGWVELIFTLLLLGGLLVGQSLMILGGGLWFLEWAAATINHLHYEIRQPDQTPVDPEGSEGCCQ